MSPWNYARPRRGSPRRPRASNSRELSSIGPPTRKWSLRGTGDPIGSRASGSDIPKNVLCRSNCPPRAYRLIPPTTAIVSAKVFVHNREPPLCPLWRLAATTIPPVPLLFEAPALESQLRSGELRDPSEPGLILWIHVELGGLRNEEKNQNGNAVARSADDFVSSVQRRGRNCWHEAIAAVNESFVQYYNGDPIRFNRVQLLFLITDSLTMYYWLLI